jgi:hyaluronoglucosaminidase
MPPELGIIEGFYGRPWSWPARARVVALLAGHGYRFHIYAPKADVYLRRQWREPHPAAAIAELARFAAHCRSLDVRFGIGLSPYGAFHAFDATARQALAAKLAIFDELGIADLAILFDDMRGDVPDLAERQAEIVHWAAARTAASRLLVCPTYYSDDPVLDRVFGPRPDDYLRRLGELLDPRFEIFWTGDEVCARQLSIGHLRRVAGIIGRRPFLWDNYPVNDGQRMSQYLHVRGFTGRPAASGEHMAAHAINPALQPTLSCVPALTLVDSYRLGDAYEYGEAQRRAAIEVLGEALGTMLHEDVLVLQDVGLDRLAEKATMLRARYEAIDHPGAREIVAWLDGEYRITDEIVRTQ